MQPNGELVKGPMTNRQREVIKLIAEDLTAKEIAARLGISCKTVEYHKSLIKKRLCVVGTAGIVKYAMSRGVIQP